MIQPVIELKRILEKESRLYEEIYRLETIKSEAIIDRDGKRMENLSKEQEVLLSRVESLENERERQIEQYRIMNNLDDLARTVTLKDIVQSMDEDSSHQLLRYGMELKELLLKLQGKQETNKKLIDDNMEFFNLLVAGIKSSSSEKSGYDRDGKENSTTVNPVIFNQTV